MTLKADGKACLCFTHERNMFCWRDKGFLSGKDPPNSNVNDLLIQRLNQTATMISFLMKIELEPLEH